MSEMKNFNKEFVERTKEILEKYYDNEKDEVTLLLNCLSALVSLPIEREKDEDSVEAQEFQEDCVKMMKQLIKKPYTNKDEGNFFRNIRNSVAHLNIKLEPNNGIIESVTLWSRNSNTGKIVLKINISVNNLKRFAEYVAQEYLDRFFK